MLVSGRVSWGAETNNFPQRTKPSCVFWWFCCGNDDGCGEICGMGWDDAGAYTPPGCNLPYHTNQDNFCPSTVCHH